MLRLFESRALISGCDGGFGAYEARIAEYCRRIPLGVWVSCYPSRSGAKIGDCRAFLDFFFPSGEGRIFKPLPSGELGPEFLLISSVC